MKRFSLTTISAGLALAVMSAPLAFAQQYQNHGDIHARPPAHVVVQHRPVPVRVVHAMPVHHMAPPRVAVKHYVPVHVEKPMHGPVKPMHGNM